jgi:hypothetical protein
MHVPTEERHYFKEKLAIRRDELLFELLTNSPTLAADCLFSARLHLLSRELSTGSLDAVVILFHCEAAIRLGGI